MRTSGNRSPDLWWASLGLIIFRLGLANTRKIFVLLLLLGCTATALSRYPLKIASSRNIPQAGFKLISSVGSQKCLKWSPPCEQTAYFTADDLSFLQHHFGVHGPQSHLAQLTSNTVDSIEPLRAQTLGILAQLKPAIIIESKKNHINPLLTSAILYDEIEHSKPGKDLPIAAHSGLFRDIGVAQLSLSELVLQHKIARNASSSEIRHAIDFYLLDPRNNVAILAAQISRLHNLVDPGNVHYLQVSQNSSDAKAAALIAYLHNGKLDYPTRILRYMQDPAIHALIFGKLAGFKSILV